MLGCNVTLTRHASMRFLVRGGARYMEERELATKVDDLYQANKAIFDSEGLMGPRYRVRIPLPDRRQLVAIIEKIRECGLKIITTWIE